MKVAKLTSEALQPCNHTLGLINIAKALAAISSGCVIRPRARKSRRRTSFTASSDLGHAWVLGHAGCSAYPIGHITGLLYGPVGRIRPPKPLKFASNGVALTRHYSY